MLGAMILSAVIFFFLDPGGLAQPIEQFSFSGRTMGTTYEVQIAGVGVTESEVQILQAMVDNELEAVNASMSTYIPDSEISIFNKTDAGLWIPLGSRFRSVLNRSDQINRLTNGAFDPTLGPLINLWGFGAQSGTEDLPTESEIKSALQEMGFDQLEVGDQGIRKNLQGLKINLSAIAKGYGVDRVAALLKAEGFDNIYVEIGGEVVCTGVNGKGIPWRIGIQVPSFDALESYTKVVELSNAALATSGDYRNYSISESGLRHHILDPRTGRPASHTLASVSVITDDCMSADAFATALFVMGTEEGFEWVKTQKGVEALFIDRGENAFEFTFTDGFKQTLVTLP